MKEKITQTLILMFLGLLLLYGHKYYEFLSGIILIGFIAIVVNSNKYPRINNFIDSVF